MKCNKCGQEFGKGTNCQYCGADKVAALGEFSGYSTPNNKPTTVKDSISSPASQHIEPITSQICWKCGEIIPLGKFCPVCGQALVRECPNARRNTPLNMISVRIAGQTVLIIKRSKNGLRFKEGLTRKSDERKSRRPSKSVPIIFLTGRICYLRSFYFAWQRLRLVSVSYYY